MVKFLEKLPFETDADLGIRSGDDIYVRLKASRDWQLRNDFKFYAEQIYRYGIDSENYLRTNLELTHARPNQPILSNQFSLTYADDQDDDLTWENRLFREHSSLQITVLTMVFIQVATTMTTIYV